MGRVINAWLLLCNSPELRAYFVSPIRYPSHPVSDIMHKYTQYIRACSQSLFPGYKAMHTNS